LVLLAMIRGTDTSKLIALLAPLHPPNNTFPGEVFIRLGAIEPDLLEEVIWWQTGDFWPYFLLAALPGSAPPQSAPPSLCRPSAGTLASSKRWNSRVRIPGRPGSSDTDRAPSTTTDAPWLWVNALPGHNATR
jgi:hypothetical protein